MRAEAIFDEHARQAPPTLSRAELRELVASLDVVGALPASDRDEKARLYRVLGLDLTYDLEASLVSVEAAPVGSSTERVGGGI